MWGGGVRRIVTRNTPSIPESMSLQQIWLPKNLMTVEYQMTLDSQKTAIFTNQTYNLWRKADPQSDFMGISSLHFWAYICKS